MKGSLFEFNTGPLLSLDFQNDWTIEEVTIDKYVFMACYVKMSLVWTRNIATTLVTTKYVRALPEITSLRWNPNVPYGVKSMH